MGPRPPKVKAWQTRWPSCDNAPVSSRGRSARRSPASTARHFDAKLWGVARLRHNDFFSPTMVIEHPADKFGDAGAGNWSHPACARSEVVVDRRAAGSRARVGSVGSRTARVRRGFSCAVVIFRRG